MGGTNNNTAVVIGSAIGAVVGTVIASLLPFEPLYLGTVAIFGGITAYLIYHFVCLLNTHTQ